MKPKFQHDCERCVFLGRYSCPIYGECDLYYADHGGLPDTLIARYGDDGPSYVSGKILIDSIPAITEAARLATERGLMALVSEEAT